MNLENTICTAYTYLEFKGSKGAYEKELSKRGSEADWDEVLKAYNFVSEHMSDEAIKQCQELIISEF